MSERPIALIDAYGLLIRHYQANPTISRSGHHMGGVVGFLKSIRSVVDKFLPSRLYVIWEGGGSPRRRSIYPDYKDRRRPLHMNSFFDDDIPDTYENRNRQIKTLIALLMDLPVCQIYVPDCEADDVIGYLCRYVHNDEEKVIISSDQDYYQLLDERTRISTFTKGKIVTKDAVLEEVGIHPNNICLARSVVGDKSDNIPGIKGAGLKTLAKRFKTLSDEGSVLLEDLLKECDEHSGDNIKVFKRISEGKDIVRRNWKLMYLDSDNLTQNQIDRITQATSTFEPSSNKISFARALVSEGLNSFDLDWFWFAIGMLHHSK